ncbi:MAG: hypothetical protein HY801_14825 [Candidatus Lindowbacteria bacterium]|nr:hypothetical protein [Candidatus Lindowbacteria bacterium]
MTAGVILSLVIENGSYVVIFLACAYGAYVNLKQSKTVPGADILAIGFLIYGIYGMLAFAGPGFTGSFFSALAKVGVLDSTTTVYFISYAARLSIILVIIGLFRVARNVKA